jgi:structural maintenance of chromosome 2
MINGHVAQQKSVENLFQSVMLNINNPHFLIMQGRITKVLNMKPPEILAMIEETAGTRMFEDRKLKAVNTMAKKDRKVEEITNLLQEVIIPKLDHLRKERSAFLEFQKTESEVDRLKRLIVAYEFYKLEEAIVRLKDDLKAKENYLQMNENNQITIKSDLSALEASIAELEKERSKEASAKLQKYEAMVNEAQNDMVKLKTQYDLKVEMLQEEEKSRNKVVEQIQQLNLQIAQREEAVLASANEFKSIKEEYEEMQTRLKRDEELLNSLTTGISKSDSNSSGYMEQIKDSREKLTEAKTKQEENALKKKHLQQELKDIEPKAKKAEKEYMGYMKTHEELTTIIANAQAQIAKYEGMDLDELPSLQKKKTQKEAEIREVGQVRYFNFF